MVGKNILKVLIKIFLITVILEIIVFNFRHWESISFPQLKKPLVRVEQGIEPIGKNQYKVVNTDEAYLDLVGVRGNFKNLYFNCQPETGIITNVTIMADDAANSAGLNLGDEVIVSTVSRSNFLRLHLNGVSNYIQIKINEQNGFSFFLDDPEINVVVPMSISWLRMCVVFLLLVLIKTFSPNSVVYAESMTIDKIWKKCGLIIFIGLHIVSILFISQLILPNKTMQDTIDNGSWPAHGQYNELADALEKGQVFLDRKPPKSLENATNPYDGAIRWNCVVTEGNEHFDIDYAYFEGRYYSYFGPVPAILFFIPYKLITGTQCRTWDVVTLCTILFCLASFGLIYVIGKRYFSNLSYGIYLLMSSFYFWGGAVVYLVYTGNVYSLPIISSLLFGTLGLTMWIAARKDGYLRKRYLLMGSFLIALIIGSRPQLAIILFLAFPIFGKEIIEEREFFSKKGVINTLLVIIPFLIIGCSMMWYNYARFHSPFDFGANYNLTSNDMTHRGFIFDRFSLGVFCYLLQPLNISPKYPFMHIVNTSNDYLGFTNIEFLFGGFFAINTLALCCLLVFKMKKELKEHGIYAISVASMVMAIVIMLLDIQMAGLTQRYMSDFGWLIILSAIIPIFMLEEIAKEHKLQKAFWQILSMLTGVCVCLNLWTLLIPERYFSLLSIRPTLFYVIKYLLFF